jgi:hypothetical protein
MPTGIRLLVAFFAFGATMCLLTVVLLLVPGTALDALWRLNPDAQTAFQSLGEFSILLMMVLGSACALAAFGLAKDRRWGINLALVILALNLAGDLVNAFARYDFRTLLGLPIGGAMIFYLSRMRSRKSENGCD